MIDDLKKKYNWKNPMKSSIPKLLAKFWAEEVTNT